MKQEMRYLIAEADPEIQDQLQQLLGEQSEIMLLPGDFSAEDLWQTIVKHQPDAAFIGNESDTEAILDVLGQVRDQGIPTASVLISDREAMAYRAFQSNVADMMPRAFTEERFDLALRRAQCMSGVRTKTVFVRTFGYFDVFVAGEPLYFSNAKAKELLAVLIDEEGGTVSMDAIIDHLWPDRPYDENVKQLYRKAVNYLNKLFDSEKLPFFSSGRGWCRVRKDAINCDLYDVLDGKPHALDLYQGRYMFAYAWGMDREAQLDRMKEEQGTW